MTQFMYLGATIKKMFVKFLQNLKNIMEEFSQMVDWKDCSFPKNAIQKTLENSSKSFETHFSARVHRQ